MARVLIPTQMPMHNGAASFALTTVTTAGFCFWNDPKTEVVIIEEGSSATSLTFLSVPDSTGRLGDQTRIVSSRIYVAAFQPTGFNAPSFTGKVNVDVTCAGTSTVQVAIISRRR